MKDRSLDNPENTQHMGLYVADQLTEWMAARQTAKQLNQAPTVKQDLKGNIAGGRLVQPDLLKPDSRWSQSILHRTEQHLLMAVIEDSMHSAFLHSTKHAPRNNMLHCLSSSHHEQHIAWDICYVQMHEFLSGRLLPTPSPATSSMSPASSC